jgi:hypothetical protein
MKIFYVIKLRDPFLRSYFDLIRFVANPSEKRTTHITVRGPYNQKFNFVGLNRLIKGKRILISGVGNFFNYNQNTVYLKADSPEMPKIWLKKGLDYNPHITIYDGHSRLLAESIYLLFYKFSFSIEFNSSELVPLIVSKGQADLDLSLIVNESLLSNFCNNNLTLNDIRDLSDSDRFTILNSLISYLPNINSSFKSIDK